MQVELTGTIPADGCVALAWRAPAALAATVLIIRTGAVPAFTSLSLAGDLTSYRIQNLSRHQRYRIAVHCAFPEGTALSPWIDVTPRAGLAPVPDSGPADLTAHVARVDRVMAMPQDGRIALYWTLTRGFADRVVIEIFKWREPWHRLEVEPEVSSVALDRARGLPLANGTAYAVRVTASFAGVSWPTTEPIAVTPAPPGQERQANQAHVQAHLLYARLCVDPEVRLFDEDAAPAEAPDARIVCAHCRRDVRWQGERLACEGCAAEFIPNGRGDFLDATRLRFGTCRCCVPRKILVQRAEALVCAHSGKEHIRGAGTSLQLIEDLPYGLCQCCRPRRPLELAGKAIRCARSKEVHRNEQGRYVLVPTQPVFDAAAIDDLLDQGFAEICSTGITTRRRGGS